MLLCVFVLSCLLCSTSSAPLSSDDESWPTSSSGEDLQLSAVFPVVGVASPEAPPLVPEAPPRLVVQVEDTKTNITVSFAIFIIAEEEEEEEEEGGSAAGARARSDDDSRSSEIDDITDDVTSEETKSQDIQPMREEHADHMIITESSEEVMRDQPMRNDHTTISDDLDDFNNSTGSEASPLSDDSDGPAPPPPADLHRHRQADKPDPDPGLQEGMSSSSEETGSVSQDGGGSGLQAVTGSIQEVLGLLTGSQAVEGGHQEVLGSAPDPLPGFSLSSEESMESSVHHTGSTEPSQRVIGPTTSFTPASASHSAEQGQEGGGLSEVMRSPEVSSSSEEATLTFTSSLTQSEESGSAGSEPDHPGLHPDHIPTSASSEVGPEESVRPDDAIREANGASSEASVQVTPDGGLKEAEEEEEEEEEEAEEEEVTHGSNRKQNGSNRKQRVSVAVVANPAQSSSEETE
ncbi:nucleolar and coiled-body phosphoprotein 1 [Larimichthys crocea]|uniref:nucleolar and coiled-body phosphoprotein 1 n=1 Tax=Larimichthys crocea TaxID=215358 RepID=UPI000F5FACC9|nr:nucleolar and coiled-body phosphoprotein 1 [Larimichthys crocea]